MPQLSEKTNSLIFPSTGTGWRAAIVLIVAVASASAATNQATSFRPVATSLVRIAVDGQDVSVAVEHGSGTSHHTIRVETEKPLMINVADYNFDGLQDFSISHVDDGMGTYVIYRIYTYSKDRHEFTELQPECGDEFINVTVAKAKRTLTNSYFVNNRVASCAVIF